MGRCDRELLCWRMQPDARAAFSVPHSHLLMGQVDRSVLSGLLSERGSGNPLDGARKALRTAWFDCDRLKLFALKNATAEECEW